MLKEDEERLREAKQGAGWTSVDESIAKNKTKARKRYAAAKTSLKNG